MYNVLYSQYQLSGVLYTLVISHWRC